MAKWRVDILQTFQTRQFMNQIHVDSGEGVMTAEQVCGIIVTHWIPAFLPLQWSQLKYVSVIATKEGSGTGEQFIQQINIAGTGSTTNTVGVLCYVMRKLTGLAGRKMRGRYYVAGIASGIIGTVPDTVTSSGMGFFTTTCNTIRTKFCGGGGSVGLQLLIKHRGPEPDYTNVVNVQPRLELGVQRRRNVGVGS